MKIEIKKIVRPIRLGDYAPEYDGQEIHVWLNPPRRVRMDHFEIVQEFSAVVDERVLVMKTALEAAAKEAGVEPEELEDKGFEMDEGTEASIAEIDAQLEDLSRRLYGWFAEVWSQDEDEGTHWTTDEVVELVEACMDADPALWSWVQDEHWRLVGEHRDGVKKK